MSALNLASPESWPVTLDADQIAAIYGRKVGGIRWSCAQHTFIPAPFQRKPYRWRREDVCRHLGIVLAPMRRTA